MLISCLPFCSRGLWCLSGIWMYVWTLTVPEKSPVLFVLHWGPCSQPYGFSTGASTEINITVYHYVNQVHFFLPPFIWGNTIIFRGLEASEVAARACEVGRCLVNCLPFTQNMLLSHQAPVYLLIPTHLCHCCTDNFPWEAFPDRLPKPELTVVLCASPPSTSRTWLRLPATCVCPSPGTWSWGSEAHHLGQSLPHDFSQRLLNEWGHLSAAYRPVLLAPRASSPPLPAAYPEPWCDIRDFHSARYVRTKMCNFRLMLPNIFIPRYLHD